MFNTNWKDSLSDALYFKTDNRGKKIKETLSSKGKKFQLNLENGNSSEWDLTLLGCILTMKPFTKNDSIAHIQSLISIRNEISHMPDFNISDAKYQEIYAKFTRAMCALGYSDESLLILRQQCLETKNQIASVSQTKSANIVFETAKREANKEIKKKNFLKAIELYNAIKPLDLSNDELCELFYIRSLAYSELYDSSHMPDEKHIYRALNDAENICMHQPSWSKGYIRTAEVYLKLNDLESARGHFEQALALDWDNVELKNALASVKRLQGEQSRKVLDMLKS